MKDNTLKYLKRMYQKTLRAALAYLLVPIGFIFEFAVTFPYIVMVSIDQRRRYAPRSKSVRKAIKGDRPE